MEVFFSIAWWCAVAFFSLIALYYLGHTIAISKRARQCADTMPLNESYSCVYYLPLMLVILFSYCRLASERNALSPDMCLPPVQLSICFGLWLSMCLCVIIQDKEKNHMTWGDDMDKTIAGFLSLFEVVRGFLLSIGKPFSKLSGRCRAAVGLAGVLFFIFFFILLDQQQELQAILLLLFLITYLLLQAYQALHSCRKLLLFWLFYGAQIALLVYSALPMPQSGAAPGFLAYVGFVILFTMIWLLMAGAADIEPARMACGIVNTATTIILIVVNVLAIWEERNFPSYGSTWNTMQHYSTVILLPLVVGGYLAALLKQMQEYWWAKEGKQAQAK